ncbi:VWA domain-containing protein [Leadbettera azotonutricia]|uniref:Putative BatA protein n=1 Tax=Leadbettera azotonutricia (strain ATCC BAA-888 / DSM 13862 / ZAS-9) TaxID=545695 RepID=F5Y7Q9_LEAAZ|nr:VWA domain-containing protein [Leadbettera azotonutricia]AEF80399.1 putative BatA protein [Leadbettera azotonutricia ZAS-9]
MSAAFDRPYLLAAAVIFIPLMLIFSRRFKPLFTLELPLGPPGGIPFKPPVNLELLLKMLHALELAGVVFLFIAAAGPHFIYTETVWFSRGADIFFVVDVSPSMAGMDMNGRSRFDAARDLVRDFAGRRPQDGLGLVAVGADAGLLVPLTTDRESLYSRLDTLAIGELGDGTALGMGLAVAGLHLRRSSAPRRAVVLITDGENNAGSVHPEAAASLLGDLGISLWVIGVGSSGEIPINYLDPNTRMRRTGTFESHYDPESLKSIAEKGNGTWIAAPSAEALATAFAKVDQGEMTIRRSGVVRRKEPFHEVFIVLALILLYGVRFIRRYILGALI